MEMSGQLHIPATLPMVPTGKEALVRPQWWSGCGGMEKNITESNPTYPVHS